MKALIRSKSLLTGLTLASCLTFTLNPCIAGGCTSSDAVVPYELDQKEQKELAEKARKIRASLPTATRQILDAHLIEAASLGNLDNVDSLLQIGADVDARTSSFRTPPIIAADRGFTEIARLLIARGANINATDTVLGRTALMNAVLGDRIIMVKLLLESHAKVAFKDMDPTVLDLASANKNGAIIRLFEKYFPTQEPTQADQKHTAASAATIAQPLTSVAASSTTPVTLPSSNTGQSQLATVLVRSQAPAISTTDPFRTAAAQLAVGHASAPSVTLATLPSSTQQAPAIPSTDLSRI